MHSAVSSPHQLTQPHTSLKDPLFSPRHGPSGSVCCRAVLPRPGGLGPPTHSLRSPWASACVGLPGSDPKSCAEWLLSSTHHTQKHGLLPMAHVTPVSPHSPSPPSVNGVVILRPPREGDEMRPTCTGARPPTPGVTVWQGLHSRELGPGCLPPNLCTFQGGVSLFIALFTHLVRMEDWGHRP